MVGTKVRRGGHVRSDLGAAVVQAVQVPLVVDAAPVGARNAPVVAGRDALVRARYALDLGAG